MQLHPGEWRGKKSLEDAGCMDRTNCCPGPGSRLWRELFFPLSFREVLAEVSDFVPIAKKDCIAFALWFFDTCRLHSALLQVTTKPSFWIFIFSIPARDPMLGKFLFFRHVLSLGSWIAPWLILATEPWHNVIFAWKEICSYVYDTHTQYLSYFFFFQRKGKGW